MASQESIPEREVFGKQTNFIKIAILKAILPVL
jgi:hypothetical protein